MAGNQKEVYYNEFCPGCEFLECSESDPEAPCWDCLEQPTNLDSHKPVNYKPKEQIR